MKGTSLSDIHFTISTIDRPRNYVHKVISSLPKDLPLRLVVGTHSYDYLRRYRRSHRIEIIGVDTNEWERFKDCRIPYRASWNYWRCFVYGVRPENRKGLAILEDDVLPAKGWQKRFCNTIDQIESQFGEEYVLALYTTDAKQAKPASNGQYYAKYPAGNFWGTQAMYYPEPVRAAFAEYLKREGVDSFKKPYDWLLSEYLRLTGTPLFATTPCLFQHIGKVTATGLCIRFFQAGHFAKAVATD